MERVDWLTSLPEQVELEVDGIGRVLFCHGSPRRDDEMIFKTRNADEVREMLDGVEADVVVCGHTHMQFDRRVDRWRVVNAGSVGLAYGGAPGAYWLELGPDVRHRRTPYDPSPLRSSEWPRAAEVLSWIESPPSEAEVIAEFEARVATLDG